MKETNINQTEKMKIFKENINKKIDKMYKLMLSYGFECKNYEKLDRYDFLIWVNKELKITIFSSLYKINHLWIKEIKISNFDNNSLNENVLNKILEIKDKKICSRCSKEVLEFKGVHFAGRYCNECWDKYKKENDNIYPCGHKAYECTC